MAFSERDRRTPHPHGQAELERGSFLSAARRELVQVSVTTPNLDLHAHEPCLIYPNLPPMSSVL